MQLRLTARTDCNAATWPKRPGLDSMGRTVRQTRETERPTTLPALWLKMQARWDRNAIRNWGRTEAAAARAAAAAINVQRTHETRYFYSTPSRIYTLFGLNVIIASASATLLLHQDGFCQLDFDSGALQVFVRMEWEPGKVDEKKRGRGVGRTGPNNVSLPAVIVHLFCVFRTKRHTLHAVRSLGVFPSHRGESESTWRAGGSTSP